MYLNLILLLFYCEILLSNYNFAYSERHEWKYLDCVTNKFRNSFNRSCYHYSYELSSPKIVKIVIENDCLYCVFRLFYANDARENNFGYPECIKQNSLYHANLYNKCNQRRQNNMILCCCNVHLCNHMFRSTSVPLSNEMTTPHLGSSSKKQKPYIKSPFSNFRWLQRKWNYRDCVSKKSIETFNGSCYHYNNEESSKVSDIIIESDCRYCLYRVFYSDNIPKISGYPECVKEDSSFQTNLYTKCFLKRMNTMLICCCSEYLCNDMFHSSLIPLSVFNFKKPLPQDTKFDNHEYKLHSTPTISFKKKLKADPWNGSDIDHGFDYKGNCSNKLLYNTSCYDYDYYRCPKGLVDVKVKDGCTFCGYGTNFKPPNFKVKIHGYPICIMNNEFMGIKLVNRECVKFNRFPRYLTENELICCCTTLCNDFFKQGVPFSHFCPTSSTSSALTTTTKSTTTTSTSTTTATTTTTKTTPSTTQSTTTRPSTTSGEPTNSTEPLTPLKLGVDCYGIWTNKTIVIYSACKGCIKTIVYNIGERPFVSCMRPHLDPFDRFEQFCNEYYLDKNVLIYVVCCYTDLCNSIDDGHYLISSVETVLFSLICICFWVYI